MRLPRTSYYLSRSLLSVVLLKEHSDNRHHTIIIIDCIVINLLVCVCMGFVVVFVLFFYFSSFPSGGCGGGCLGVWSTFWNESKRKITHLQPIKNKNKKVPRNKRTRLPTYRQTSLRRRWPLRRRRLRRCLSELRLRIVPSTRNSSATVLKIRIRTRRIKRKEKGREVIKEMVDVVDIRRRRSSTSGDRWSPPPPQWLRIGWSWRMRTRSVPPQTWKTAPKRTWMTMDSVASEL